MARPDPRAAVGVLIAASCWGLSGTAAQALFQHQGVPVGWLVTTRMGASGLALLLWVALTMGKRAIWGVFSSWRGFFRLLFFSLFGMLAVQWTYMAAISSGNAASATLLQYVGPTLVVLYGALRLRRLPSRREAAAALSTLLGTWLLVSSGSMTALAVPAGGVFWGLASACALAFYTLWPVSLLARWGPLPITGWAMVIGALVLTPFAPPWHIGDARLTAVSWLLIAFVILLGTLAPFALYLWSLTHLPPERASLLSCAEPLVATLAAVVWLGVPMNLAQVLGGTAIVGAVLLLLKKPREVTPSSGASHASAPMG